MVYRSLKPMLAASWRMLSIACGVFTLDCSGWNEPLGFFIVIFGGRSSTA